MHNSRTTPRNASASELSDVQKKIRQSRSDTVRNSVIEEQIPMPNINALKSMFQAGSAGVQNAAAHGRRSGTSAARSRRTDASEKMQDEIKKGKSTGGDCISTKSKEHDELDLDHINHTQRFHVTRAMFAKMEEQNKKDKLMAETKHIHRSKSPTRYPGAYTRLTLSPMNSNNLDAGTKAAPPCSLTLDKSSGNLKQSEKFGVHLKSNVKGSSTSVDSTSGDAKLPQVENSRENVLENVPSPKWLMQHYEEVAKGFSSNTELKKNSDVEKQSFHINQNFVDKSKASNAQSKFGGALNPEITSPLMAGQSSSICLDAGNSAFRDNHSNGLTDAKSSYSRFNTKSGSHSADATRDSKVFVTTATKLISPQSDMASCFRNSSLSDVFSPSVGDAVGKKQPTFSPEEDINEKLEAWKIKRKGASESSDYVDSEWLPADEAGKFSEKEDSNLESFGASEGKRAGDVGSARHDRVEGASLDELEANKNEFEDQLTSSFSSDEALDSNEFKSNGNVYHLLDNGDFYYEIDGVPDVEDDDDNSFQSTKRPLRVRFSTQKIKVFSTYSVEEYDRKNEDVDPMAASAEYELEKRVEKMTLYNVEFYKGEDGLGLSIIGMGVGADSGLEKLGIFIKTLTPGGAAERVGKIEVNDQIIEVDGNSLVGVTQSYAATVLRNTSGLVRFVMGREKDPANSEVARLIQQAIEQDKRRADMQKQEMLMRQQMLTQEGSNLDDQRYDDTESDGEHAYQPYSSESIYMESLPPRLPGEGMTSSDYEGIDGLAPVNNSVYIQLSEAQQHIARLQAELAKSNAKVSTSDMMTNEFVEKLSIAEKNLLQARFEKSQLQDKLQEREKEFLEKELIIKANIERLQRECVSTKDLLLPREEISKLDKDALISYLTEMIQQVQKMDMKSHVKHDLVKKLKLSIEILCKDHPDVLEFHKNVDLPKKGLAESQRPDNVEEWNTERVVKWMQSNNFSNYVTAFIVRKINGKQLLSLDSNQLKDLGVTVEQDQEAIKSKILDLALKMRNRKDAAEQ